MFCASCGTQIPEGSGFCPECGAACKQGQQSAPEGMNQGAVPPASAYQGPVPQPGMNPGAMSQPGMNPGAVPPPGMGMNQGAVPPPPPGAFYGAPGNMNPPKKKSSLPLVVGAAAALAVFVIIIAVAARYIKAGKEPGRTEGRSGNTGFSETVQPGGSNETGGTGSYDTEGLNTEDINTEESGGTSGFFEDRGITLTSEEDVFEFTTMMIDQENSEDVKEEPVTAAVTITENTDDTAPGYKNVCAAFVIDYSQSKDDGRHPLIWVSAFDKETGISFESADQGPITIESAGRSYDIAISFEGEREYPRAYRYVKVTCPEDYNGTIFQIGYASLKMREENDKIDYHSGRYKIDELPYYGSHDYLFFQYGYEKTPPIGEKMVQDVIDSYNGEGNSSLEWGEGNSPWNQLPED